VERNVKLVIGLSGVNVMLHVEEATGSEGSLFVVILTMIKHWTSVCSIAKWTKAILIT
jgi:hypothetical protein